ncbi:MAG: transcription-repair coupling factor [Deltaproteobacteria bacterium]|nr:transcription-repair coupling factor [Deltaproteobacteria bacterium]
MKIDNPYVKQVNSWLDQGTRDIQITGITGTSRGFLLAQVLLAAERPSLVVLPTAQEAVRVYRELGFFLPESFTAPDPGDRRLYEFPVYDISPLAGLSPHQNVINRRLQALYALKSEKSPIVITSVEAVLLKILPKEAFLGALEYLETGEEIGREKLIAKLETNGYQRSSLVEEMGDYSVRGGVLDFYPPLYSRPVRLEFWGDHIESIRHFEPLSQRSTDHLKEVILLPANEIIMDNAAMKRARSKGRLPEQGAEGCAFSGQEAWLNHFYPKLHTLLDYFPANGLLVRLDPYRQIKERDRFREKIRSDTERFMQEAMERGTPFPVTEGVLLSVDEWNAAFEPFTKIDFHELPLEPPSVTFNFLEIKGASEVDADLDVKLAIKGRVSMAPLAEKMSDWMDQGARVVLVCRTEQQADRLKEILRNYDVTVEEVAKRWFRISPQKGLSICLGRLSKGFAWPELGLYVISEDEIFGPKRSKAKGKKATDERGLDWTGFSQLNVGDLVVHQDHGIGRYGGLSKMEVANKINDFVMVEYAEKDRLYIPADRISVLQKYMGADDRDPKLDRLGGTSWNVAKQKAKKDIREIAKQLVEIYALRRHREGFAFSRPDHTFKEFEAAFEHEETPDQIAAIDEVLSDMGKNRPMDRLICGDVGYGKTEVAMRAAFKAVTDGKQVALLVPTTVLAEQHYETFRKRMTPHGIIVGVLSRFRSRTEQKEIVGKTRSGQIDILIGTHRILQKDIGFKDLGLLIIDEEQRFGVKQKEKLKQYRALVDVLALTATPIPRSLHLSLMGVRDLSVIETPPEERLAIQTHLSHFDEATVKRAIETELARGGQVFFVHNRVKTIARRAQEVMNLVPEAKVAVAHGQMPEKDLEETMIRFLHNEINVLVCTTIIESGLDIPSANTIIIDQADRFGLSQIYQLRGRVGRSAENAYAYLLLSDDLRLTRDAEKRLKALMDFSDLGAGIHLAMHDLRIRGGGNILGYAQSGHIAAIGYELYLSLVEQAVAELKGDEWHEEVNPEINVDLHAYLPEDYISDIDIRLNLYRRLSKLTEEADLKVIAEEILDRFGPLPQDVANLLMVMAVRLDLKRIRVNRLDVQRDALIFSFTQDSPVDINHLVQLAAAKPFRYRFLSDAKLQVRIPNGTVIQALHEAKAVIQEWKRGDE